MTNHNLRILLDIGHPAHVHYFKNFIRLMKEKEHDFIIIARNRSIIFDLLHAYNFDFISIVRASPLTGSRATLARNVAS